MKHKHIFLTLIGSLILLSGCTAQSDEHVISEITSTPIVTTTPSESTKTTESSTQTGALVQTTDAATTKATEKEAEATTTQMVQSSENVLNSGASDGEVQTNAPSEFEEANPASQNSEQPKGNSYTPPSGLEFDEDILIGTASSENDKQNSPEDFPDTDQPVIPDRVIELPFLPAE